MLSAEVELLDEAETEFHSPGDRPTDDQVTQLLRMVRSWRGVLSNPLSNHHEAAQQYGFILYR